MMGLAGTVLAIEPAELNNRLRQLGAKFDTMQATADKRIPADTLRKAKGIVLMDRTKAGFLFAYEGGGGAAMVRDPKTDAWGPVAFVSASEASLGFQIGGEQNFYVILLMTTNATRFLTEPNYNFGGEARGTAGDASSGQEGKVDTGEPPYVVYDLRKGLYGGAAIKGGAVSADDKANQVYYGQYLTMKDILFDHKVQPTQPAMDLAAKLEAQAKLNTASNSANKPPASNPPAQNSGSNSAGKDTASNSGSK